MHRPGIEPGPPAWQASILPLNQRCSSSLMLCSSTAVVAEWLRRLTRNQFPSGSVGSNPTDRESFFQSQLIPIIVMTQLCLHGSAREHRWFSGRMLACHAGGPGSIPGRCNQFCLFFRPPLTIQYWEKSARYRNFESGRPFDFIVMKHHCRE